MIIAKTQIGPIEITYGAKAITGIKLLDVFASRAKKQKRSKVIEKPPAFAVELARALELHLGGKAQDFSRVPLDYSAVPAFHARVYEASRSIASGERVSYGGLAARVGSPGASRAIGSAMAKNPFFVVVPCHRILAANQKLGGFSAPGGATTKRRMLEIEGAFLEPPPYDGARALRELRKVDPLLGKLITSAGNRVPRITPLTTLFDALGRSIIYQQLNGRAAASIHAKYAALFPDHRPTPERLVKMSDAKVRAAGLSGSKLAALRDLAAKSIAGDLPTHAKMKTMTDDAIIESLTRVRGIGPWTVHMLLIFRLGRPDVLPLADYGVRKGFAKIYGARRSLEKHAESWRPWRSVASWYMWRALE